MVNIRRGGLTACLLAATMLATACAGGDALQEGGGGQDGSSAQGTVVIGSTNFYEQLILAHMYAQVLRANGVKVETRLNLGNREVVFPSLKSGEISVLPEYTGSLLNFLTGGDTTASKPDEVLAQLRKELPEGIVALEPAAAQNKDALVVTRQTAKKYDLETVSDLKGVAGELVIGGPPELETRALGLPGYKKVYGLEFKDFVPLDAGGPLTKSALKKGDIDVARLFSTDPAIAKNNWVVLKDDKNLQPAQQLIPVIRTEVLTPTIKKTLNELSSHLTTEAITELNAKVVLDKKDPSKVAHNWLVKEGLLKG